MEKVGFFGGCFNPVTKAHLDLIRQVIKQENLNKVYFVPMGDLYPKKDLICLEHRIEMLKLAFEEDDKMDILAISNQNEKMHASDTFQKIDEMFPQVQRVFIMGSDNFEKIKKWKNAEELMKNYQYIILNRNQGKTKEISSTKVRQNVKLEQTIEELVPKKVREYIEQKNLYK